VVCLNTIYLKAIKSVEFKGSKGDCVKAMISHLYFMTPTAP